MSFDEELQQWEASIPQEIRADALWHATAYRMALFIADRCRESVHQLAQNPRYENVATQLGKALESISANYAEAYSRSTIGDRTRFYEYSLGSAREARDWTFKARHALGQPLVSEMIPFISRITQLLTVTIVRERGRATKPLRRTRSRHDG